MNYNQLILTDRIQLMVLIPSFNLKVANLAYC